MFKKFLHKIYTNLIFLNFYLSKKKINKFIFIHPPQSGGNTIDYFFKINFGLRTYKIHDYLDYKIFDFSDEKLKEYFLIFGHFPYEFAFRKIYDQKYYFFTSIRNPEDRYLSNYYRNKRDEEKKGLKFMSLEEFLKMRIDQGLDNFYVRYFSSENIYANNLIEVNENHFQDSLKNLKKLNFIFFLDDMAQNIKEFKKNFRLFIDMSIFLNLHKNKVSNSSYPIIAEKERQLLQRLTFYDLKLYNEIKKFKKEK